MLIKKIEKSKIEKSLTYILLFFLFFSDSPSAEKFGEAASYNDPYLVFAVKLLHPTSPFMETIIRSAKLDIFKYGTLPVNSTNSSSLPSSNALVTIYHIAVDSKTGEKTRTAVDSKIVNWQESGWETFDIATAVQTWLDRPDSDGNLKFELASSLRPTELYQILHVSRLRKRSLREREPRLNVKTSERSILGRAKRDAHTGDCVKGDGEKQCCRFSVEINFKEIDWQNWVIAPESFKAYYCQGECGHTRMANDWAMIKRVIHLKDPEKMPVDVCCTPNKLSDLSLLHYTEEGQLELTDKKDVVVQDCRCR